MRSAVVLLAAVSFSGALASQPGVGDLAPRLALTSIVQGPIDVGQVSWDSLRDHVVVLEFWSTWCGPCVAAIPHLADLAEGFRDQPVRFISVTNEEEAVFGDF
jgi:thiol-disulfide isomerase/thioredoxin